MMPPQPPHVWAWCEVSPLLTANRLADQQGADKKQPILS